MSWSWLAYLAGVATLPAAAGVLLLLSLTVLPDATISRECVACDWKTTSRIRVRRWLSGARHNLAVGRTEWHLRALLEHAHRFGVPHPRTDALERRLAKATERRVARHGNRTPALTGRYRPLREPTEFIAG